MNKFLTPILLLFLFSFNISLKAVHVAGGDITYSALGNNQYKIYLSIYADCATGSSNLFGKTQPIKFKSTCGGTASLSVKIVDSAPFGTEISQLCASQLSNSKCKGGIFPGMWMFRYEGVITLAPVCNTWKMSWTECCRNGAITNLTGPLSQSNYIESTLNSLNDSTNSSPQFHAQPIPYVCVNQPVSYSYGVSEPDGDSLRYQIIPALKAAGSPLAYNPTYSGFSPIPGITINPSTGLVTFTPTIIGNFVVVVRITEFDRITKQVLGTVMRDMQFVVINCNNTVPSATAGTISNFSGNAIQKGPYTIEMCAGNTFNFTATYTDVDLTDSLTFLTDSASSLPGAIITKVGTGTNTLTLNINWTAPGGSQGKNLTFTIIISDGACPIVGQQTYTYQVKILDATVASSDITICGSQTAQLDATGGSIFDWSVISGDPITPTNFSCNPCSNPIASPSITTTYELVSNLTGTCKSRDTVTVYVVPDFTFNMTQASTSSCLLVPVQLGVINLFPEASGYTYHWAPATNLNNATLQNPIATFNSAGTYTYTLTVTNPYGCIKKDSLTITAIHANNPLITAYVDTLICPGETATLGLNFSNSILPTSCGLSSTGNCNGAGPDITIGTGSSKNASTSYPAVYGDRYKNARQQFLFTAAELATAGLVAGKIDRLDFNVDKIIGTNLYNNYTIYLGCTNVTALTKWETGLVQVYDPKTHTVTTGWNAHLFDNAFIWDGISNIIVEICFDNRTNATFSNNSINFFTPTTFVSCLYYRNNITTACGATNFVITSKNRPNVRFHNCTVAADPASYSYQWLPANANIADPNAQNTTGQPTSTTTYTVMVTDIANGCSTTDTVNVNIMNIVNVHIAPINPICISASPINLSITSTPSGAGFWTGNGITNATTGIFDPTVAGVGIHQLVYTVNAACGNVADTTIIEVIPLPDATILPVPDQCITAAPIILNTAIAGGNWSGTAISANGIFDPTAAGVGSHQVIYTVTTVACGNIADTINIAVVPLTTVTITPVTDQCITGATITLNATPANGNWAGSGITSANAGTFDPSVAKVGIHEIIYTINDSCGSVADTTHVVVLALPDATITPVPEQCITGTPVILNAATTNGVWKGVGVTSGSFAPAIAGVGSHMITYTINSPCVSIDTILISVSVPANPLITNVNPLCTTSPSIVLAATNSGGSWSGPGIMPGNGVFDPAIAGPGKHIISYTISGACISSDTAIVSVIPSPAISFNTNKTEGCGPTTIEFRGQSDQPIGTCLWDFGNGNTSTNFNPAIIYQVAGSYSVTLTCSNIIGCSSSVAQNNLITIHSQPIAGYTASSQPTTILDPSVQFNDASTGQIDVWSWNFGQLGNSTLPNPYMVYPDTGLHPFQLIVSNIYNCSDTLNGIIDIDPIATFFAPNAFTPNSNGTNDTFMVYADGIDSNTFEMLIYNRWGELIFKSNNIYNGWNGRRGNTGILLESDAYVWQVKFNDFSGKENSRIGHVTLVK